MKPVHSLLATLCAALAACVLFATLAVATASARQTGSVLPPNGVYTCDWIAAHSAEALQAGVTCDAAVFFSAMSSPIAGPASAIVVSPNVIDSSDCWDVPENGTRIGPGVFTWSSWEYSHYWNWYPYYGPPFDYTWYIQKPGPTTVKYDRVTDGGVHEWTLAASNNYRWGAQNHTNPAQSFSVCHVG
jgi:hypothetical protein